MKKMYTIVDNVGDHGREVLLEDPEGGGQNREVLQQYCGRLD